MEKFLWTLLLYRALIHLMLKHIRIKNLNLDGERSKMKDRTSQNQTNISIVRQVLGLKKKTSRELRKLYSSLFQEEPLYNTNKDQLRHKIAYRLQELALGGLDEQTKAKLGSIAKGDSVISKARHSDLLVGTKICKEYSGALHQVEVTKDGFEYNGQKWRSLSAIATKITGTKWNGPKFFRLRG